ncbi:MAG: hypothetical protein ABIH85_00125 [Candidatus Omnitrophota bacterium]
MTKKKTNAISFNNPLGYVLARQKETNEIIAYLRVYVTDNKIKQKAIRYISKYRNTFIDPISIGTERALDENIKVEHYVKYADYCLKIFDIAGLYSFEDKYVRLFFNLNYGSGKTLFNRKMKGATRKVILSLIEKMGGLKKNIKQLQSKALGKSISLKDTQKGFAYTLYFLNLKNDGKTSSLSFREIAKRVGIHHETVKKYIEEVKGMSENERKKFLSCTIDASMKFAKKFTTPEYFDENDEYKLSR